MHRGCRNQGATSGAGGIGTGRGPSSRSRSPPAGPGRVPGRRACPSAAPSSVEAFPDPPHVSGPLTVELRPALAADERRPPLPARPGGRPLCSTDGSGGYRALGNRGPVVVDEVSTAPSDDHTSWATTVRFAAASRAAVRRARDQAAGFGGVVVVTVGDDRRHGHRAGRPDAPPGHPLRSRKGRSVVGRGRIRSAQTRSKQGM